MRPAQLPSTVEMLFIADPALLEQYASLLSINVKVEICTDINHRSVHRAGVIKVYPVKLAEAVIPGTLSIANAHYVVETLKVATDLLLENKAHSIFKKIKCNLFIKK